VKFSPFPSEIELAMVMKIKPLRVPHQFVEPLIRSRVAASAMRDLLKFPVKFLGKKDKLLSQFLQLIPPPEDYDTYIGLFAGTEAMFRYLDTLEHLDGKRVVFVENNWRTYNLLLQLKTNFDKMVRQFELLTLDYSPEEYRAMQEKFNAGKLSVVRNAVYLIYFRNMCYRGVYREDKQGHFKVIPNDNPPRVIFNMEKLEKLHIALQKVEIIWGDATKYVQNERYVPPGSFIYADPTYTTTEFNQYGKDVFTPLDFLRFMQICRTDLSARGCLWMVSNSFDLSYMPSDPLSEGYNFATVFRRDTLNHGRMAEGEDGQKIQYFIPESVLRNYRTEPMDAVYLRQAEILEPLQLLYLKLHLGGISFHQAMQSSIESMEAMGPLLADPSVTIRNFPDELKPISSLFPVSADFDAGAAEGAADEFLQGLRSVLSVPHARRIDFPGAFADLAELHAPRN